MGRMKSQLVATLFAFSAVITPAATAGQAAPKPQTATPARTSAATPEGGMAIRYHGETTPKASRDAGSFNGRTAAFEAVNLGSNPSPAATPHPSMVA